MLRALARGRSADASPFAAAQLFPARVVRIIVAFPAGGQSDLIARAVAKSLGELLGVAMVVENRSGASGTISAMICRRTPADGSALLLGSGSI